MPIYMDLHIVPGVKAKDVAEAHRKDLLIQNEHKCKCMTYWIDEERGTIFCLIDAPDKDAVSEMHGRAHGLVPNKIIEVSGKVVQSFLGRIFDPSEAEITAGGLKVFSDPSFRTLLIIRMEDPVLLQHELGSEGADALLGKLTTIVRTSLVKCGGTEVEHDQPGFVISFLSAATAVSCALSIVNNLPPADADAVGLRIVANAGEPVEKSERLFGDVLQHAAHLCSVAGDCRVVISSPVKRLIENDYFQTRRNDIVVLSPQDEDFLRSLFSSFEEHWQDADFEVPDYCMAMAMSASQLYRRVITLTGMSLNVLLKEFRLAKAKDMMKQHRHSISQITFDSGFTSASYFTKCFKKKFGLLPMAYLDLLG